MNRKRIGLLAILLCLAGLEPVSLASARAEDANVLSRESVLGDPEIPALGNPKGDLTIVEYFDYQCPYCKKVSPELQRVVREDGKVRLVLKEWPVFGGVSIYAARLALAAKYQNKYGEAHDALMGLHQKLTEENVRTALSEAGIDTQRALDDLAAHAAAIDALLARNHTQALALDFRGTPAFIIGQFRVPGALDAAGFKLAIRDARARQAGQSRGKP